MKYYTVHWSIDLIANDPIDAAREALKIHRDAESMALVFKVIDEDGNEETVDLMEKEQ